MSGHHSDGARSRESFQEGRARASRPVPSLPVPSVGTPHSRRMVTDRRSRTCAPENARSHQPVENGLRLLTKVLRQVATSQRFTSYTDVKHAFRQQLGVLRVRYQQHEFDDAFGLVGSNRRLWHEPPAPQRTWHVEHLDTRGFSKAEAAQFMSELPGVIRAMPPAMGKRA